MRCVPVVVGEHGVAAADAVIGGALDLADVVTVRVTKSAGGLTRLLRSERDRPEERS